MQDGFSIDGKTMRDANGYCTNPEHVRHLGPCRLGYRKDRTTRSVS